MALCIILGVLFVGWVLLSMKTSRPDGTLLPKTKIHPYRTMMSYIMPTRNEALVYYDSYVFAEELLRYIEEAKKHFPCDVTHCALGAVASVADANPKMNQFVMGRRLYQRNGWYITFSMKRTKLNKEAKLAAVKLRFTPGHTFRDLADRINRRIGDERTDKVTRDDQELGFLVRLPRPLLRVACGLVRVLDYYNILPKFFIDGDGFYTSIFVANLGSLDMGAPYHHLFEWGNAPLFMSIGKIEERAWVVDGQVVPRKILHIRYSYDERIDDGLTTRAGIAGAKYALEHPFEVLGCLDPAGSDARPLYQGVHEPEAASATAA